MTREQKALVTKGLHGMREALVSGNSLDHAYWRGYFEALRDLFENSLNELVSRAQDEEETIGDLAEVLYK